MISYVKTFLYNRDIRIFQEQMVVQTHRHDSSTFPSKSKTETFSRQGILKIYL